MGNKIPYNKKLDSGKQWGGGGPRDLQQKQNTTYGNAVIQLPNMSVEELKRLLGNASPINKNGNNQMPLDEVKRKIDEAVKFTIEQERKRYESGIRNLNDQLNTLKRRSVAINEQLVEKNAEIKRLKNQIIDGPQDLNNKLDEKNNEINVLKVRIEEKDKVIERLSNSYNENIDILRCKLEEIDNKLVHGISVTSEHEKDSDRPKIADDVFIDPIEDGGVELDPHIKIDADGISSEGVTRNIKEDLDKLRHLLNKSKDSPIKIKED